MTINTGINSISDFYDILQNNKSCVILKFGADWCGPCKKIEHHVNNWFEKIEKEQNDIQLIYIDVDESFEIYAYLKTKKMIQGIPAILAYYKGNISCIFNESVVGTNELVIDQFFETVCKFCMISTPTYYPINP
jgi:thiol-disulfide isomerase/thioredoxin